MSPEENLAQVSAAYIRLKLAMQGIAACATRCDGCQMLADVARRALDDVAKLTDLQGDPPRG